MRNPDLVFSKFQLKGIVWLCKKTENRYPDKFSSILAVLKKAGFLYINGEIVPDPDYKGE